MTPEDSAALARAVQSLEHPGFAARLANMAGKPIELIGGALPAPVRHTISTATTKALQSALKVALRTMHGDRKGGSRLMHKVLATASGAAGGAFGLVTLPIELPVSTIIMLRSIAEIARSEGEDPSDPEAALSCIQVFALGGRAGSPDASESGYFAVRGVLAKSVSEAARFVTERGLIGRGSNSRPLYLAGGFPLRSGADAKVRGTGSPTRRCIGRRFSELPVYRAFPGHRTRSFHRASAGKSVWKGRCTSGV